MSFIGSRVRGRIAVGTVGEYELRTCNFELGPVPDRPARAGA
jgi:hypothetical protein